MLNSPGETTCVTLRVAGERELRAQRLHVEARALAQEERERREDSDGGASR